MWQDVDVTGGGREGGGGGWDGAGGGRGGRGGGIWVGGGGVGEGGGGGGGETAREMFMECGGYCWVGGSQAAVLSDVFVTATSPYSAFQPLWLGHTSKTLSFEPA